MWGLFRRRQCFVPTWRGALALFAVFLLFGFLFVKTIHPFLAPNDLVPGGVLVVEGWAADYELAAGVAQFRSNHYDRIFVTGGPLEWGAPLSEYRTYAERGAAVILKWGLTTNEVQAVPAPEVKHDRTYTAAISLAKWFREHHISPTRVQLMSVGPHARRSRLLYQQALGPDVRVGVIAVPDKDYNPKQWWHYSAGVRGVIDETVAYIYAKFFFHPPPE